MTQENKSFEYTYSAKEQAEIKKIREKYEAPRDNGADKMEQLRRLDAGVTKRGTIASLIIGVIGAIIMGTGMSMVMTNLGDILGMPYAMPIGIVIGVIGMIGVASAYPIYNYITRKERERIASEIIRLTDELMK